MSRRIGKLLRVEPLHNPGRLKLRWVLTKDDKERSHIGVIEWNRRLRKYTFAALASREFCQESLREILLFLEKENGRLSPTAPTSQAHTQTVP